MSRMMLVVSALAFAFAGARSYETKDYECMADLIIVLDESNSIHPPRFKQLREFVTNITDSIEVGVDHTRVGVMTYATKPRVIYRLGQSQTNEAVRNAITSIGQAGGNTFTDRALLMLRETMLTSGPQRAQRRQGLRTVVVIITDGYSTEPKKTKAEAELARQSGALFIAIGVGDKIDNEELAAIVGTHGLVLTVKDTAGLSTISREVVTKVCEKTSTCPCPNTTPCCKPIPETTALCPCSTTIPAPELIPGCPGTKPIDLIWAVSNQAGVEETKAALDLIASTVSGMLLGPEGVQVGLAPRQGESKAEIRLDDHDTHGQFWEDLEGRELSGAQTDDAINYIRTKGMSPRNGARSNSTKYGILIVDNRFENWNKTFREAALAKDSQIRLIVIGVGRNVRHRQLRLVASTPEDYLYVDSYGALADLRTRIIESLCRGILGHQGRRIRRHKEKGRHTKRDRHSKTRRRIPDAASSRSSA